MARPPKRKTPGGRVTPKGGPTTTRPAASSRYTPPVPRVYKESPRWVPILMFGLLGVGLIVIFCNYVGLVPGDTSNIWLLVGLAFILGGIVTATQYR